MAYTTINKHTAHFNTKLYTGNASSQSITGLDFKPSLVWLKNRDSAYAHSLFDLHRGTNARIRTESTNSQDNPSPSALTAFNSDGFTVGGDIGVNQNNEDIVGWNWYSADTMGSANTDGSLNTYATTANTTAGFSIISYTGNGTSGATIGHGLGAVPKMIIIKRLSGTASNWAIYHNKLNGGTNPEVKYLEFNTNAELDDAGIFNDTALTSSLITLGNSDKTNYSGANYIAYCFAEKTGYSKFGSYTSNNNADGTFVYTGFKPAFLMIKNITTGNTSWEMYDSKRPGFNVTNKYLRANTNVADVSSDRLDLLSNGFKLRQVGDTNYNADVMIYMAFGQSLVGSNNVPCTAR